jgi:Fe-S oxidoreductase
MTDADSLKLGELKADSAIVLTARSGAESMSDELKGLLGEKVIEEKRKSFYTLSEQLYDLIRTVQYDKGVVYHENCPAAFNNAGATWLSNVRDSKNPYLPVTKPDCGEVTDSLNFGAKK